MRLKTSRPTPSVPKYVCVAKSGPEALPNESRNAVDCSFGGRAPSRSMIGPAKTATKHRNTMNIAETIVTRSCLIRRQNSCRGERAAMSAGISTPGAMPPSVSWISSGAPVLTAGALLGGGFW